MAHARLQTLAEGENGARGLNKRLTFPFCKSTQTRQFPATLTRTETKQETFGLCSGTICLAISQIARLSLNQSAVQFIYLLTLYFS